MTSKPPAAADLFQSAHDEGTLSRTALDTLTGVTDLGAEIEAAMGPSVDEVAASEVILLTVLVDDSLSISSAGNEGIVMLGHNEVIDSLIKSKQQDNILVHTRYLHGKILNPFGPIDAATLMDAGNYDTQYGTPLYDQAVVVLGTVLAEAQKFIENGVPVRTITLIVTDGADVGSVQGPDAVKAIVDDMMGQETHIVAAMGITDGTTDYGQVFTEMGIVKKWILTPKNNQSEIRKAFAVFSQSAVRASQSSAAEFSKLGGFSSDTASV